MIDAKKIKELREETGASMLDCNKILAETGGDMDKARKILMEKGKMKVGKKADRVVSEGIVEAYIHSNKKVGVIVELLCESDFVAKNVQFQELAHDIAMHIAAVNPQYVSAAEIPSAIIETEREKAMVEFKDKKPKEMLENIVNGKIKKYTDTISLVSQPYVKDPEKTINDIINETISKLGENIKVKRFCRFQIE